jgi:hypothetical protein
MSCFSREGARVKILETRKPGDDSLTGEWVVEALTDAA